MKLNARNIMLLCVTILIGYLYYPTFLELFKIWEFDTFYSHGFLIPLVSGFLVWQKREKLKELPKDFNYWGVPVVTVSLAVFLLFAQNDVVVQAVTFVFLVFGTIVLFFGAPVARETLFPVFFLFFMIPFQIENRLGVPLRMFASFVSAKFLAFLGFTIERTGTLIYMDGTALDVAPACSGLRSLLSLSAFGAVWAYLTDVKFYKKAVIFLSSIPIAVAGNMVRINLTALSVKVLGYEAAFGLFHKASGVFLFLFCLAALAALANLFKKTESNPL